MKGTRSVCHIFRRTDSLSILHLHVAQSPPSSPPPRGLEAAEAAGSVGSASPSLAHLPKSHTASILATTTPVAPAEESPHIGSIKSPSHHPFCWLCSSWHFVASFPSAFGALWSCPEAGFMWLLQVQQALSADDCRQSKHNSFWLIQLSPPTQGLSGALCTIPRLALVEDVQMKCLGCMDHFPRGCKPPSPCAGAAGWEWGSTQPCSIESHKVGNDL